MAIQRGEIYFVNLNPVKGREQSGQRPVLVFSSDLVNRLPLVVTVVIGTKGQNISRDYPTKARRPAYSRLDTSKFAKDFGFRLPDWRTGVREVIGELAEAKNA